MAVTGVFAADFASFYDACQKAEVSLKTFESGAGKVESSLNRMVDSFSGRKVIQEATLMTEAIERAGGTSKLTASELERAGVRAAEAAEKMRALGMDVPPGIQRLADTTTAFGAASRGAAPHVNTLKGSLSQFDGVLASMGVNIGPQIRGLNDLAGASGQTALGLGAVATAGLVVGAGVAGWKIGRAVADFFDLDQAIGDATAKLLGFADTPAAVKADILAKASRLAGTDIKDMALALAINEEAMKTSIATAELTNDTFARLTAPGKAAKDLALWAAELAKVASDGVLDDLQRDIESHAFSVQELADRYRVLPAAVRAFTRDLEAAAAVHVKNATLLAKTATDLAQAQKAGAKIEADSILVTSRLWEEYTALRVAHGGTANEKAIADLNKWAANLTATMVRAGADTAEFYEALGAIATEKLDGIGIDWAYWNANTISAQNEVAQNARKMYDAMVHSGEFHRDALESQRQKMLGLEDAARGMGATTVAAFNDSTEAAMRLSAETQHLAEIKKGLATGWFNADGNVVTSASHDMTRADLQGFAKSKGIPVQAAVSMAERGFSFQEMQLAVAGGLIDTWVPHGPRIPGFAAGVQNFSGGLARVHQDELLVNLPPGTDVIPASRGGGGGPSFVNHIYVNGTAADVAKKVSVELMRQLKTQHQFRSM